VLPLLSVCCSLISFYLNKYVICSSCDIGFLFYCSILRVFQNIIEFVFLILCESDELPLSKVQMETTEERKKTKTNNKQKRNDTTLFKN